MGKPHTPSKSGDGCPCVPKRCYFKKQHFFLDNPVISLDGLYKEIKSIKMGNQADLLAEVWDSLSDSVKGPRPAYIKIDDEDYNKHYICVLCRENSGQWVLGVYLYAWDKEDK